VFIGHFAVGFASKKYAPRANLAALLAAALFLDVLWPIFVIAGWEQVRIDPGNTRFTPLDFVRYPWSHSLLMSMAWATAFALVFYASSRYRRGAVVIWIGVVSHWILDWISHRPDMPLYPGGPKLGLGLWNSIPGTMIVEVAMYAAGVYLYTHATRACDASGRYLLWAFVGLLGVLYLADRFSPAPPSVAAIAWTGIAAAVIFLPWSWWIDQHRTTDL
jgi:LexA-binding, inner membrane-associated putative hydrolase